MTGIYKYQNLINNKIYIGKGIDIAQRRRDHRFDAERKNDNCIFHKALRKYGEENFSFEIIEKCNQNELNEKEQYWIAYYHSYIKDPLCKGGYNMTPGGDGGQGELFKKPVCQYDLMGNFIQEYESASEAARQLNVFKSNLTAACRGETSQCGGYQWKYKDEDKEIKIVAVKNGKLVAQYDKEMNLIKIYLSAVEAAKETGIGVGSIRNCCNGFTKSGGGYIWRHWKEE